MYEARPQFSVVIPAHNEAAVLGPNLARWLPRLAPGEADVTVVANGCSDDTADVARAHGARVVELPEPSKVAALNLGDRQAAQVFPRIYLDADVGITVEAIRAAVDALRTEEPRVAGLTPTFLVEGSSWAVRSFYRMYSQLPYVREGLVGLGFYGLSAAGRARFDHFPELTADDLFVQRVFAPEERIVLPHRFEVHVPLDARNLIRVRRRSAAGARQLAARSAELGLGVTGGPTTRGTGEALRRAALRNPRAAVDAGAYAAVVAAARLAGRRRGNTWGRDESSRATPAAPGPSARGGSRVGYLVSMHPALSHTFVNREIHALERAGVTVYRFSVRPCPPDQLLTEETRREAALTRVLLGSPTRLWLAAHFGLLRSSPGAWFAGFMSALRAGRLTLRGRVWQIFYFAEAVLLLHIARPLGVRHFHVHFANNGADVARRAVAIARHVDGADAWSWSFAMHGPTEFQDPERFDLPAKVLDADFVACISEYARRRLLALVPADAQPRLELVPMSVDVRRFPPLANVRRGRATSRVLYVGRLVPEKGPDVLVRAVALLRKSGALRPAVTIVGAGPLRGDLERLIESLGVQEDVVLAGPVGQDALPDHYAAADVFCLPSFDEGLPVVLMEAMATELSVLTTRIAGVPELVADDVNGLLVPPGDEHAIAAGLSRLLLDGDLRERLGRAARPRVLERHSPDANARALLSLLKRHARLESSADARKDGKWGRIP